MGLTVDLETGRAACTESVEALLQAVDTMSEHDLLGGSRCHGWTRLDVVVHVIAGWQEMLGGLVSSVDTEPSVDAATYWRAFATQYADDDPVLTLMSQRRRTAAYARPSAATGHLHDVGAALLHGLAGCPDGPRRWDTHVFAAGDFLAVWAVENVVHHLDLLVTEPPPAGGVQLARATIETLVGEPLPASWTDVDAALIGTGRVPVPDEQAALAPRLPALG